jgi:hypothetical protein
LNDGRFDLWQLLDFVESVIFIIPRFDLQYDSKYQKKAEKMTGRVLLRLSFQTPNVPQRILDVQAVKGKSNPNPVQSFSGGQPSTAKRMLVTMVKAEGLLAKDAGGTSDPFGELILGQQIKRTKVIDKTLTPCWNETFGFDLTAENTSLSILSVVVYDNDKGMIYGNTKEYLGSIELPVKELLIEGSIEKWCVLSMDLIQLIS